MSGRPTRANSGGRAYLDLRKLAAATGRPTDELLQLYALEGFLDRLGRSPHATRFVQGELMLPIGETDVVACHFPYRGDSHDQDRYVDHRPADRGLWLLHGHVHERWRQRGRMLNVGVDAWDYRPVSAAALAAIVRSGPADL